MWSQWVLLSPIGLCLTTAGYIIWSLMKSNMLRCVWMVWLNVQCFNSVCSSYSTWLLVGSDTHRLWPSGLKCTNKEEHSYIKVPNLVIEDIDNLYAEGSSVCGNERVRNWTLKRTYFYIITLPGQVFIVMIHVCWTFVCIQEVYVRGSLVDNIAC